MDIFGTDMISQRCPAPTSIKPRRNYRDADKSLARPTSEVFCLIVRIFCLMLVLLYTYIYSTNIPPIMIINRIYETQNLLSL